MRAKVHNQVDVFQVLKKMDQPNEVLMVHRLLNPNFTLQFRFAVIYVGFAARVLGLEIGLRDNLAGILFLVVGDLHYSVAGGKTTLAQPLCLDIAPRWVFRVVYDEVYLLLLDLDVDAWLLPLAAKNGAVQGR